jgi:hypothetical protein
MSMAKEAASKDTVSKDTITFRVSETMENQIKSRAALEGCSPSDLIRSAISEYLGRDLNIHAQMSGATESLRSDIKFLDKKTELGNSLFLYWLKYYFTFTKGISDIPSEERKALIEAGERRQRVMLESFKKDMKRNSQTLLEILLADYLAEES